MRDGKESLRRLEEQAVQLRLQHDVPGAGRADACKVQVLRRETHTATEVVTQDAVPGAFELRLRRRLDLRSGTRGRSGRHKHANTRTQTRKHTHTNTQTHTPWKLGWVFDVPTSSMLGTFSQRVSSNQARGEQTDVRAGQRPSQF